MPEHVRTGARRRDNIPCCFLENFDRMLCNGARIFAQTCVEGGLSAAGLSGGKVHTNAEAVENVHDRFTSLREEKSTRQVMKSWTTIILLL